jgi:hypothetical protein
MKIKSTLFIAGFIVACVLLSAVCSKKSENPMIPQEEEKPPVTAAIGASGGTVGMEGLTVQVPAGAFDKNTTLAVSRSAAANPFGTNGVTDVYTLSGLPEAFLKPIRFSLKIKAGITVTKPGIGVGLPGGESGAGESETVYIVQAADDSSGYLVGRLGIRGGPRMAKRSRSVADESILCLFGFGNFEETESSAHFATDYCGLFSRSVVQNFNNRLEALYSKVTVDLKMPFRNGINAELPGTPGWAPFIAWGFPIRVLAKEMSGTVNFMHNIKSDFEYPYSPWINVNESLLGSSRSAEVEPSMGWAILYICALTCYPDIGSWLNRAVATWSQEYFSSPGTFDKPGKFAGNEMAPFNGMEAGDKIFAAGYDHGYGMAAVIKYLVDSPAFGTDGIGRTYQAITGKANQSAVLVGGVNALPADWWPGFFKAYIGGNIYGLTRSNFDFTSPSRLAGSWVVDAAHLEAVYSSSDGKVGAYPDMSAKLFLADVGGYSLDEEDGMLIDANGDVSDEGISVLVFAVHPSSLEFLGMQHASTANPEITGLKANKTAGISRYLIAVVNSTHNASFTGSSDIDLTLKIRKTEKMPVFTGCRFTFKMQGEYHHWNTIGYDGIRTSNISGGTGDAMPGAFDGYMFEEERTKSEIINNVTVKNTETLSLTLNSDLKSIASLDWRLINTTDAPGEFPSTTYTETHIVLKNIPINLSASGFDYNYEIKGEAVASAVTACEKDYHLTTSTNEVFYSLLRFFSDPDSYIMVRLERER